jgi:hypothetical protein
MVDFFHVKVHPKNKIYGRRPVRTDEVKLHLGCLWERLDGGSWQKRIMKLKWR